VIAIGLSRSLSNNTPEAIGELTGSPASAPACRLARDTGHEKISSPTKSCKNATPVRIENKYLSLQVLFL
jgi:hypothetical protein